MVQIRDIAAQTLLAAKDREAGTSMTADEHKPTTPATPQPAQPIHATNHTSGEAIASLVLGILAWPSVAAFGLGIVFGILAVIFGHIARGKIRRAQPPGSVDGDVMAIIGLILGYIAIGIGLIALLFFFGIAAVLFSGALAQ